jgi:hypothetical protein
MQISTKGPTPRRMNCGPRSSRPFRRYTKSPCVLLLIGTITLSACGGSNSNSSTQIPLTLSGNWQFTMAPPADGSFSGGLQGGFLLQNSSAVTGSVAYSFVVPASPNPVSSSGSATINPGSLTGQNIALTATAGTLSFTLTGTLNLDSATLEGTYTCASASAPSGTTCAPAQTGGTAQTQMQWSAILVPPLTGSIQGTIHSAGGTAGLNGQEFLVSGALNQAANTGASSATVTGNLNFLNSTTNQSDYPCFTLASVAGQISGNTVTLQILGNDGSSIGQIGASPTAAAGLGTVTFSSSQGGAYVLQSLTGTAYAVYSAACGGGSLQDPADFGNICVAVNSTTACQEPVTLTPSALIFGSQMLNSPPTTQTIMLANTYGSTLGSLTLSLTNIPPPAANFTETDTCGANGVPSGGQPFELLAKQSCVITISFAPQESCAPGILAAQCLSATLTVTSTDNNAIFTVPMTGGVSASEASTPELDFAGDGGSEARLPEWPMFTNQNGHPAQTMPSASTRPFQGTEHHAEVDSRSDE